MKKIIILSAISTLLIGLSTAQAKNNHQNISVNPSLIKAERISAQKRMLAQKLSQNYKQLAPLLRANINEQHTQAPLSTFLDHQSQLAFTQQMVQADKKIRKWKGIENETNELLEVRLANKNSLNAWQDSKVDPLFSYEPSGDDSQWQYIEAFDIYGNVHQLDVYQAPEVPVFVIDSNSDKELKAGLNVMRAKIKQISKSSLVQQNEELSNHSPSTLMSEQKLTTAPIQTTQLKKIRLEYDQEPWISGRAEVFALINGVDPSRDKPTIDLIEMPYLDYDQTDYFPDQVLVHWTRYRWGAADIILMEQDDGTDYAELAVLLMQVAEEILKSIPDPEVQGYAIIPQITTKIIQALPDGILTNDDDFVDVFYTIMQDSSYVDHPAAGGNAVITLEPLEIDPTRP